MLDNVTSSNRNENPEPSCFVGSTLVVTPAGRYRIDELARLSAAKAARALEVQGYLSQCVQAKQAQLAQFDAAAGALISTLPAQQAQSLQATLTAERAALEATLDEEIAQKSENLNAELAAILPNVLTLDPDTGEIVERPIVRAWKAKTTPGLVDVVIDTVFTQEGNVQQEVSVKVRCTPEHRFIGPNGEAQAVDLAGQQVYRLEDGAAQAWQVSNVQTYEAPDPVAVYDLEVEGIASFFVAPYNNCCAVLVHNCTTSSSVKPKPAPEPASPIKITRRFSLKKTEYAEREVTVDFATGKKLRCRVPVEWSDNAAAVLMSKYAVRKGVPDSMGGVDGREVDAERIFDRMVTGWRKAAIDNGYWSEGDKFEPGLFCLEIKAMLEQQIAAPNSPQWFNTGVSAVYGIKAGTDGHYKATPNKHSDVLAHRCEDSLEYPQISACFIQSVEDNLVGEGGIMDLWQREARLFKYGSGSGANYSALRGKGEPLSRGGYSSGLLSFLRVGDRSAGAIKSGGTTRRSARMVIVDADHPDVEDFIAWKSNEDAKIRALHEAGFGDPSSFEDEATETVSGQNANNSVAVPDDFMRAAVDGESWDLRARVDGSVTKTVDAGELFDKIAEAAWQCADPGLQFSDTINRWHTCKNDGPIRAANPCSMAGDTLIPTEHGFSRIDELAAMDARGEALPKVWCFDAGEAKLLPCARAWQSGDAKILVRVEAEGQSIICTPEHRFLLAGGEYEQARYLVGGQVLQGTQGTIVVRRVSQFAAADNGAAPVYDIEVKGPHNFAVTSAPELPPIVVHNSEYVFLDDTACNLASLNLAKFYRPDRVDERCFDFDAYFDACVLWTIVLDISVSMAGYPTAEIARRSMLYRTLGLGYAALGELLVLKGLGYGTQEGREFAAELTSLMTAAAYYTSTQLAEKLGPFPRFEANRASALEVLERHAQHSPEATKDLWRMVIERADQHGLRNAQVSLLAPTGTIGIVMDCETTGVEPYYSDTVFKKLAGGGMMRLPSKRFTQVLEAAGYSATDRTRNVWAIENGKPVEYMWVDPPEELQDVLVCADDLTPHAHVLMMAAVQPFLSGAISKTVNMPASASVEAVREMYLFAWEQGLKSISIYRDGCKPSQPLRGRKPSLDVTAFVSFEAAQAFLAASEELVVVRKAATPAIIAPSKPALTRGERRQTPDIATSKRFRIELSGHTFYLSCAEFEDGTLAEVFVTSPRIGSAISGWVNAWAKTLSLALQHGTPLGTLISAMQGLSFEPAGYYDGGPVASFVDCFARIAEKHYLGRPEGAEQAEGASTPAAPATAEKAVFVAVDAKLTGNACGACGSFDMRQSGTCYVCKSCGETTGCS